MKKIISLLISLCLVFSIIAFGNVMRVSALTSGDYEYVKLSSTTAEITFYNGTDFDVVIPEYINGLKVVSIGDYCFENASVLSESRITSVTMPNSIISIGRESFRKCVNMTYIKLSNSLQVIGESAFWNCGLKSVVIPASCHTIEYGAFEECEYLKKAVIYPTTTSIGDQCFNIGLGDWNGNLTIYGKSGSYAHKYAQVKEIKFKNIYKPSKPAKVSVPVLKSSKKKTVSVKWKKISGVKYKIAYSTSKSKLAALRSGSISASGVKVLDSTSVSKNISKLKSKKNYYFKVCAYKTYYNTSDKTYYVLGSWSSTRSIKVK